MLLLKQCKNEYKKILKENVKNIKQIKSFNQIMGSWYFKQLLTNAQIKKIIQNDSSISLSDIKKIMIEKITQKNQKELQKDLQKIENILKHDKITRGKIEVKWVKSNTWGYCPQGYYHNGHEYVKHKVITGWGYDKLSMLTANILNNDIYFKAYLFNYCQNHNINKNNIEKKLYYGVRMFNGIPYMETGVGISCHVAILKKIGFNVDYIELKKNNCIQFELKNKRK